MYVARQVVYVENITWNAGGVVHVTPVYTCTECYEHIVTDSDEMCVHVQVKCDVMYQRVVTGLYLAEQKYFLAS